MLRFPSLRHHCCLAYIVTVTCLLMSSAQEAKDGIIPLDDDDLITVKCMLRYLYTLEYDDSEGGPVTSDLGTPYPSAILTDDGEPTVQTPPLLATDISMEKEDIEPQPIITPEIQKYKLMSNVHVYALAEKYEIGPLKELAMAKTKALSGSDVVISSINFVEYMQDVIEAVYTNTPETNLGLRDMTVRACGFKVTTMLLDENMVNIIKEHGDFGLELLRWSEIEREETNSYFEHQASQLSSQIAVSEVKLLPFKEAVDGLLRTFNGWFPHHVPEKGDSKSNFDYLHTQFQGLKTGLESIQSMMTTDS